MITQIIDLVSKEFADREKMVIAGIKANQTRREALYEKQISEIAEKNKNLRPIKSSAGYHAPVDGYLGNDGQEYLKGQFISVAEIDPESWKVYSFREYTSRFKFPLEMFETISEMFLSLKNNEDAYITHGKTWNENGVEVANFFFTGDLAYLKGLAEVHVQIMDLLKENANQNKGDSPVGKVSIQGEIINISTKFDDYYGPKEVMTVKLDNGSTVWGTLPKALQDSEAGTRIQFTAAACGKHSFFKRPSKVSVL